MTPASHAPADTLPSYLRLVQGVGLRIAVTGTRGRSTLAALTAGALRRRGLIVHCNAPRRPTGSEAAAPMQRVAALLGMSAADRSLLARARGDVRAGGPVGAIVLADYAQSAAGQREFNATVCLPHYVLIPNVRHESAGLGSRSPAALARDLANTATPGATLVLGEPDPAVRLAVRRACERRGVPLIETPPQRADVPGSEAIAVLDAMVHHRFGAGLAVEEIEAMRNELQGRFRWMPSSIPGVRWFNAGSIHDVDSVKIVLGHLQAAQRHPVTYVAYLRHDRPGRTRSFIPLLADLLAAPDTRQVLLCGHRAGAVAAQLAGWESQVRVVPDDVADLPRLLRLLQFECQGGAVVTLVNGAPEWPKGLASMLQAHGSAADAPPSPRPEQAPVAVPRRSVRPVVAAAAVDSAQPEPASGEATPLPGEPTAVLPQMRVPAQVAAASPLKRRAEA